MKKFAFFVSLVMCVFLSIAAHAEPPFENSFDIGSDIFNENDPSIAFELVYKGIEERTAYDRRYLESRTEDMYIFTILFIDGHSVEFQVNLEFGTEIPAGDEVEFYAYIIGQMPFALRADLDFVILHKGDEKWLATANSVVVYTETNTYPILGILEEVMFHELVHVSLDPLYQDAEGLRTAREADGEYISEYEQERPDREAVAETFLPYVAHQMKRDRIPESTAAIIEETMSARIAYFDSLNLNMEPLQEYDFHINAGLNDAWYEPNTAGQGILLTVLPEHEMLFLAWFTFDTERPPEGTPSLLGGAGQRWITAQGPYEGNVATLKVYQTTGGVFNTQSPKPVTPQEGDGTIILEFASCSEALLRYNIISLGISGEIPVERIAQDNVPICGTGIFD